MTEWIISSCVLILAIVGIRYLFRGRVSAKVQYALWGLVLLRLLIPVSIGSSSASAANLPQVVGKQPAVQNVAEAVQTPIQVQSYEEAYSQVAQQYEALGQDVSSMQGLQLEAFQAEVAELMEGETPAEILKRIVVSVWLVGMAAVAGVFVLTNLRFRRQLRSNCRKLETESELPIYAAQGLDTPCLFGLTHPAVYLTEMTVRDPVVMYHAIAHEMTHYRHGDHIWAVLRSVCLALHWYNPLVWWAAMLSQRDGELACDEATILRLGEGERAAYGRTLIEMTCGKKADMLLCATTMTSGGIKERIHRIARKPRTAVITLAVVLLIALGVVGCTFTGAKESDDAPTEPGETAPVQTDPTVNYLEGQIGGVPKDAVLVCNVADLMGKDVAYVPAASIRDNLNTYYHYGRRLKKDLREVLRSAVAGTEQLILSGAEGCYISVRELPYFEIHTQSTSVGFLCYLFTEDLEPAGEIQFFVRDGELQYNHPSLYGLRSSYGHLRYMLREPAREHIIVTNGHSYMLLDENNQIQYGNTQAKYKVKGDYFHALDWEAMAVSYNELIAPENLVWLSFVTSEMIYEASQQGAEVLVKYLPYIDWGDYERKYGDMETVAVFDLMDIVKEWVIQEPTYDRMKAAMTQIQETDAAYAEYYAIMLTELFEVNKPLFANICLNDLSDEQEQEVISHISYNWWISEEEARARLEAELPG